MTKIDANLSKKSNEEKLKTVEEEVSSGGVEADGAKNSTSAADPIILIGGVDLINGVGTQNTKPNAAPSPTSAFLKRDEFFNWSAIRRVSMCQMIMATMAMLCILGSITVSGLNSYRFMEFILAVYLFMTGHKGFKGSSQSFEHLIFYMIMSALQWMISVFVLTCLTYSLYEVPYYTTRYQTRFDFDYDPYSISLMITELFGAAAMIGTFVTGMLGLAACCRGFGNMLTKQTKILKQQQINAESA